MRKGQTPDPFPLAFRAIQTVSMLSIRLLVDLRSCGPPKRTEYDPRFKDAGLLISSLFFFFTQMPTR